MKKVKPGKKLLYIEWEDHWTDISGKWWDVQDAHKKDIEPLVNCSVGFLMSENKKCVFISPLMGRLDPNVEQSYKYGHSIIKSCIVKRKELRV